MPPRPRNLVLLRNISQRNNLSSVRICQLDDLYKVWATRDIHLMAEVSIRVFSEKISEEKGNQRHKYNFSGS